MTAPTTSPALRATGVHVTLGATRVLDGVDVEVHAGEVVALVGPNGAGKSTLLGVLAGDVAPDSGEVLLDGMPIVGRAPAELARRRGMLLQENRLSFPFAVREVVRMGRAPWRRTPREDDDEAVVDAALLTADVSHLAERAYPTLSGGEKSRSSFARVLAQQPGVLLLDEPTAALDIRHQEAVLSHARALAAGLQGEPAVVVVVLHDLTLAAAYADRVVVLDEGRVAAAGTPRAVLTAPLLTSVYRHPVDVFDRPGTGDLVVLPRRAAHGVPA